METQYFVVIGDDDTVQCMTADELMNLLRVVLMPPQDAEPGWQPEPIVMWTRHQ